MSHEDEDFARAIALSLQDSSRSKPEIIDLATTDDEEGDDNTRFERDLQHAIAASQADNSQRKPSSAVSSSGSESLKVRGKEPEQPQSQAPNPISSFMAERAQLEKERRERQKRLRPEAFDVPTQDNDDEQDDDDSPEPPAKRQHISSSTLSSSRSNVHGNSSAQPIKEDLPINQVFWDGELRQTATRFADPRKDGRPTFRLTEILGPVAINFFDGLTLYSRYQQQSDLSFAILSSYSLDWGWIYPFFDRSVPVIMVAHPDPATSGQASVKHVLPNWVRTTPVLRGGFGCQHMKFMLLFYKTGRLRIVISSANLIAYDWRDMENSVWLQDIPLRSRPLEPSSNNADDFPGTLQRMLYSINVKPALTAMINDNHPDLPIKSIDELRQRWDWSNVKAQLVASIAGKHEGWPSAIQTGHPRLMMAVRRLGMRPGKGNKRKELLLECQGSSLGTYTTQWLNEFHWSTRGESAEDWLDSSKKSRERLPLPPVKIVFPTNATVKESAAGEEGGGTIFCRRKQWSSKNFPRSLFHDSRSNAGPVLMHSKMIIATLKDHGFSAIGSSKRRRDEPSDTEDEDSDDIEVVDPAVGWAYVGSHNFTPSAWGTLSGSSFNPILNITNYEVGVVFLLKDHHDVDRVACFQRPPKKYTSKDEPWIQEESAYHQQE